MAMEDLHTRLAIIESQLQQQRDLLEIHSVLTRYSLALDWLDDSILDTVFYNSAQIDYGFFVGSGRDFKPVLMSAMRGLGRRFHYTGQVRAEIEGDTAEVESYNLSAAMADVSSGPQSEIVQFYGKYLDSFLKRNGKWGIIRRKHVMISSVRLPEVSAQNAFAQLNQIGLTGSGHPDYRPVLAQPLDD
jgi:hypothetical protein